MIILIDNGHGVDTPGKRSPDGRLREYDFNRKLARRLQASLAQCGLDARILVPETNDLSLAQRVSRVNAVCRSVGAANVRLISLHVNAAGNDGRWHDARGFSVFCSKNASAASHHLATCLTDEAVRMRLTGNRVVPGCRYWTWSWTTGDIYLLRNTLCPAVLTECMFQDNRSDVDWLLSASGLDSLVTLHTNAILKHLKPLSNE